MKKVLHVGLDVDDKSFHIGAFCSDTGEVFELTSRPTQGDLINKLEKFQNQNFEIKLCYEATYIGYSLYRSLRKENIDAEIIAPSLIPELASKRVKTDRLDANKMAKYYAAGLLTKIYVPTVEDEHERDLIRSRSFMVDQRKDLKKHILSACRRNNLHYKQENKALSHWTTPHLKWLVSEVNKLPCTLRITLEILICQLTKLDECINEFEEKIDELSETEKYKKKKDSLSCFRGISTLTAMTLVTEIGDVKRFKHPKQLTSYAGLDVTEYSSGGKEKKFGITKMGNKRIRTAVIESCQRADNAKVLNKRLKAHRENQDIKIIEVADRCMKRLKKSQFTYWHQVNIRTK
jgi:transposase